MNTKSVRWIAMVVGLTLTGIHAEAGPFSNHPIFSKLIGEWTAKGELETATGEKLPVTETWTGVIGDDDVLTITGSRTLNGADQEFTWKYSYNAASEIFHGEYFETGMETPLDFEISVATTTRTIELETPFKNVGTLSVKSVLAENGDSIESVIKIFDAQNQNMISGTVKHTRTPSK